jgi:hypothetical protein
MRSQILAFLTVLIFAAPAGAVLTDGSCNDAINVGSGPCRPGAPIQMVKSGMVTIDAGELDLVAGDIDFIGIAALSIDDVITVTTTPLDDAAFQVPDTIVGVFDSTTTDPVTEILCRGNDTANNAQDTCPGGDCPGWGSVCRYLVTTPGDYYVGVTGFRPMSPGGCTPGVNCTSWPFDGGIGATPCEETETFTCGTYQVTIAINTLPESGVILQLAAGGTVLTWLNRRRNRRSILRSRR